MSALGAARIATCDQGITLLTLLRWWLNSGTELLFLGFDLIDRTVAFDVATEVKNQAVLFVGMQPESTADALVQQARRHGWSQHNHAVDTRRIEAGRQHVHVAEESQRLRIKERTACITSKASEKLVTLFGRSIASDETALDFVLITECVDDLLSVSDAGCEDQDGLAVRG